MKLIKLTTIDPNVNLATEEYFLKYCDENLNDDILILWKNKNTIVIGNSQNAFSEINLIFVNDNKTNVVRRITGGGAVFHDLGNLNYTIIKRNVERNYKFQDSLSFIIDFLKSNNINSSFSTKNDILIDSKKISGIAVTYNKNDCLIHGTLLYDVDIFMLVSSLNVDNKKLTSKGIESIKSRVTNIKEYYNKKSIDEFEHDLIGWIENKFNNKFEYLDLSKNQKIIELMESKYCKYEYVFGKNYFFNFSNSIKLDQSLLSVKINIDMGLIKEIHFYTDAIYESNLDALSTILLNQKYTIEQIKEILKNIDLSLFYKELDLDKVIILLFDTN